MEEEQATTRKRKAVVSAGEAAAIHYDNQIVPPRFISSKMMRRSNMMVHVSDRSMPRVTAVTTSSIDQQSRPCFTSLPRDLFYNVVAYLGPTSSSLCALSQVTHEHRSMMMSIGDVMLTRTKLRFRTPLPPKSTFESSISLFVRHARASKAVDDSLKVLDDVLKKDLPYINTSVFNFKEQSKRMPSLQSSSSLSGAIVDPSEVNRALDIALCLLGYPTTTGLANANEARRITNNAATTALEWRVTSLCSKLGARAYKYAKSRMCRRYEREDELFSSYAAVTDEMLSLEDDDDDSTYDDDDDEDMSSIDPSELEADMDMNILDKASLCMQYVVLREQQKTRQRSSRDAAFIQQGVSTIIGQAAVREFVHSIYNHA